MKIPITSIKSLPLILNKFFTSGIFVPFIVILVITYIYENFAFSSDPENASLISASEYEKNYKIFSGNIGGLYNRIGDLLDKQSRNEENKIETLGFKLANERTNGGLDNVVNVLSNSNSFGFIQEATIDKEDVLRQQVQYITPLYMERMHILYDYNQFKKFSPDNRIPELSSNLDTAIKLFFEKK